MSKAEAAVETLVGMIERGELRLPEMQRRYVWRSTRVRDLPDSLYRDYPSGAILLWDTDEEVPLQDMAVAQQNNPDQSTRLLLDGQQRLTSLCHHIFPKAVLKSSYTGREADDIANLCFIAGKTNRQISDKPPRQYFPAMIDKSGLAAFEAQSIPTDTELLGVDDYKAFLQRRRELVSQAAE